MNNKKVLVISFDIPYPDNYGGAKDVWQKILLLKQNGYCIDLISIYQDDNRLISWHKSTAREIINVDLAFKLQRGWASWLSILPISVIARKLSKPNVKECLQSLNSEYDVILVEHLKCWQTYLSLRHHLRCKKVFIRLHNIEYEHFHNFAIQESNLLKSIAYKLESFKYYILEKKSKTYKYFDKILLISETESQHYIYNNIKNKFIIKPYINLNSADIINDFNNRENSILYVGNLDLPDNRESIKAIVNILNPILEKKIVKLTVAGRYSSDNQSKLDFLLKNPNVSVRLNLESNELIKLYSQSKIFFNYSLNHSGIKLKLMEAFSYGLPTLSNGDGYLGSGLDAYVLDIDNLQASELEQKIIKLIEDSDYWYQTKLQTLEAIKKLQQNMVENYLKLFAE